MRRIWLRIRRWFLGTIYRFEKALGCWITEHDLCELCHSETVGEVCIGCQARICYLCDSGYYSDENLCNKCRKEITPEEEAEDRRLQAEYDADVPDDFLV